MRRQLNVTRFRLTSHDSLRSSFIRQNPSAQGTPDRQSRRCRKNDAVASKRRPCDGPVGDRDGILRCRQLGALMIDLLALILWQGKRVQTAVKRMVEGVVENQSEDSHGKQAGDPRNR